MKLRVSNPKDYGHERRAKPFHIEMWRDAIPDDDWFIPDWKDDHPYLKGPFATKDEAQSAIDAYNTVTSLASRYWHRFTWPDQQGTVMLIARDPNPKAFRVIDGTFEYSVEGNNDLYLKDFPWPIEVVSLSKPWADHTDYVVVMGDSEQAIKAVIQQINDGDAKGLARLFSMSAEVDADASKSTVEH